MMVCKAGILVFWFTLIEIFHLDTVVQGSETFTSTNLTIESPLFTFSINKLAINRPTWFRCFTGSASPAQTIDWGRTNIEKPYTEIYRGYCPTITGDTGPILEDKCAIRDIQTPGDNGGTVTESILFLFNEIDNVKGYSCWTKVQEQIVQRDFTFSVADVDVADSVNLYYINIHGVRKDYNIKPTLKW